MFFVDFLGWIMKLCYDLVGNFGVAIILFTIVSRIIILPISIWVQKNSIKMVKMQPAVNRIKIKYFGDKETIAEEESKIYKEYKYNPKTGKMEATGKMIEKIVEPASMFDINKTLMRCLTKNFAMFGLGLYIFAGEDLPESDEEKDKEQDEITPQEKAKVTKAVNKEIKADDLDTRYGQWMTYWNNHEWTQPANSSFRKFLDEAKDYDAEKLNTLVALFKSKAPEMNDQMPDWA
jgi:hypothetical protein